MHCHKRLLDKKTATAKNSMANTLSIKAKLKYFIFSIYDITGLKMGAFEIDDILVLTFLLTYFVNLNVHRAELVVVKTPF